MLFGAMWWNDDPQEGIRFAKILDRRGYDFLWHGDSHIALKDCFSYLTLYALNTSRVKLAPGVANLTTRDPTVVAAAACTLNEISNGRAALGLGRGDNAVRAIGLEPMKIGPFTQNARMVKALCNGEEVLYNNLRVKLNWARGRIPLYLAAYGPKMLEFAGQIADGVILQIAEPNVIKWMMKYIRKGADSVGRDLGDIDIAVFTACHISNDQKRARDMVRYYPATIVSNHVLELMSRYSTSELPTELITNMEKLKGQYDHSEHGKIGSKLEALVPDSVVDSFTIAGDSEKCKSKILELEKTGVTHVNLYVTKGDEEHLLNTFAEQVMPTFR